MKKLSVLILLSVAICLAAFKKEKTFFEKPAGFPAPVYDFKKNPLSAAKIELGRMLFYDPVLSKDSTISCASCHSQYNAFAHIDHDLSHGIEGKIGTRNAPALMNLAWNTSFMWDGSVNHLDVQALAPIANPIEMNESIANVVKKLQASKVYPKMFYSAYRDSAIAGQYVLKCISQFMLTLVSANAKYDSVKRGEQQFTESEAKGYTLFQKNCNTCHTEPLFTSQKFENNGLAVDETLNDIGKMKVTHDRNDSLKFKVPTLRNIEFTYPYMHDGRFKNLSQVLNNYIRGVQHTPTLSPQLQKGIYMTNVEKSDLIAFLLTLSDKQFIYNPKFSYPGLKNNLPAAEGLSESQRQIRQP
jgi:cytochrome c peroxidase